MRNLESSPYLQNAELVEIKAVNDKNQQRTNEFSLNISLKGIEAPAKNRPDACDRRNASVSSSREKGHAGNHEMGRSYDFRRNPTPEPA